MTSRSAPGMHRPPQRTASGGVRWPPNGSSHAQQSRQPALQRDSPMIDLTLDAQPSNVASSASPTLTGAAAPLNGVAMHTDGASDVDVRTSDNVATLGRPRMLGKFRWSFGLPAEGTSSDASDDPALDEQASISPSQPETLDASPLLPTRFRAEPQAGAAARKAGLPPTHPTQDAILKPYVLEPPAGAPLLSPDHRADFFPWQGNHPEDNLTGEIIRNGYFDRPHMPQNEYQSARASLWPSIRHKTGLQVLSAVYAQVIQQRRAQGRIAGPSTFKPPPRVTLTDTKREAWLRDLANASVPLRRLSRTIPHGIRGKVLLEQCLGKSIPTGRAVWLAKCVGANEMRAVKRKGASAPFAMGNEAKWIRDWTVFVEQFMESVAGSVGSPEWDTKMTYAARLSAHLFSEQLLDQEHYLRWTLASFEGAALHTLPAWALNLQIYWKPLARCRRHGRRLAVVLLHKIKLVQGMLDACSDESDMPEQKIEVSTAELRENLEHLLNTLGNFVDTLVKATPENFVGPSLWKEHETTFRWRAGALMHKRRTELNYIDERNTRLTSPVIRRFGLSVHAKKFIHSLDECPTFFNVHELARDVREAGHQPGFTVQMLFRWATSPHRTGQYRVHLFVRLMRRWSREGQFDTDAEMLTALSEVDDSYDRHNVYLSISELVRSRDFSVGQYLQWLIARGTLAKARESTDPPCEVRLLAELPLSSIPNHLLNLRRMLLSNVGVRCEQEAIHLSQLQRQLSHFSEDLFASKDMEDEMFLDWDPATLTRLSRTHKSEMGRWIRQRVGQHVTSGEAIGSNNWKDLSTEKGISVITPTQFNVVRAALEQMQDFSILADVVKLVSSSDNPVILASAAETLSYHLETFAAIGALEGCFKLLFERLKLLTTRKVTDKSLLTSLKELAALIPSATLECRQLAHLLSQCDQRSFVVSSPVSDHTADMLQSADADFGDELDKFLSLGSTIDKETMRRYFDMVTARFQTASEASDPHYLGYSVSLARLRSLDQSEFDGLAGEWTKRVVTEKERPPLARMWTPLVVAGCLDIESCMSCLMEAFDTCACTEDELATLRGSVIEFLRLLVQQDNSVPEPLDYDSYHFRLQQERYARDNGVQIFRLSRWVLGGVPESMHEEAVVLLTKTSLSRSVMHAVTHRTTDVCKMIADDHSDKPLTVWVKMERVIEALMALPYNHDDFEDITAELINLLNASDAVLLPFCQVKLTLMFKCTTYLEATVETDILAGCLLEAIEATDSFENTTSTPLWIELVEGLEESVAQLLVDKAERELLSYLKSPKGFEARALPTLEALKKGISIPGRHLAIVEAVAQKYPNALASAVPPLLVEALEIFVQRKSLGVDLFHDGDRWTIWDKSNVLTFWLTILLRLLTIHKAALASKSVSMSDQVRILASLGMIILHKDVLERNSSLTVPFGEHVFDMAACLSDNVSQDALSQVQTRMVRSLAPYKAPMSAPQTQQPQSLQCTPPQTLPPELLYILNLSSYALTSIAPPSQCIYSDPLLLRHKVPGPTPTQGATAAHQTTPSKSRLATAASRFTTTAFPLRHWEMLSEPTPMMMGANDTSLSLSLFGAFKV